MQNMPPKIHTSVVYDSVLRTLARPKENVVRPQSEYFRGSLYAAGYRSKAVLRLDQTDEYDSDVKAILCTVGATMISDHQGDVQHATWLCPTRNG